MWRSISELALVAVALGGCGSDAPTLDICARGDRDVVAAQVKSLELQFEDASGAAVGKPATLSPHSAHIGDSAPSGATRARVTGFDAGGAPIAHGDAELDAGGGCVCFALDTQARVVCQAIGCSVSAGTCHFYDASGDAISSQTVGFGEQADVTNVTADTFIQSDEATIGHDGTTMEAGPNPPRVALLRFDLAAMPASAVIESATLRVHTCAATGCESSMALDVLAVNESWTEQATWETRDGTTAWSQPGCAGSCVTAPIASLPGAAASTSVSTTIPAQTIQGWIGSANNFGIALSRSGTAGTALHLDASETTLADAAPRLDITFHLP